MADSEQTAGYEDGSLHHAQVGSTPYDDWPNVEDSLSAAIGVGMMYHGLEQLPFYSSGVVKRIVTAPDQSGDEVYVFFELRGGTVLKATFTEVSEDGIAPERKQEAEQSDSTAP